MNYNDFFSRLGFDFKKDLKSIDLVFDKNDTLTQNLTNSVFYYKSPPNTNTSFYLITTVLKTNEIEEIRRYIWNKNDAELIFYYPYEGAKLVMLYGKYSPKNTYNESILDSFSTTQKDLEKIDKIKHWQFDSGVFWFNYRKYIDKAKYKGIDKELVSTLEALKKELDKALLKLILDENERNEVVQALIDRTLYIKYLEDNHIINSYFYNHYFKDSTLNYEKLLLNKELNLNTLFEVIHEIFNNSLFERPTIDNKYLTQDVRGLIANSFNTNLNTGQLKLFHFQFDILPVEFISYIYEVFLSDKQKENGIYYTPKKLAQLIIDEVIYEDKIGSILDPSSGSGMFLIVGYQRLLEIARKQNLEPKDSLGKIRFRTQLLSENIFGIEKELTAQRFTLFSLSLQIFKGINPEDIKNFIANELEHNRRINLFSEFPFFENIKRANTLDINDKPFADKKFSYLVGNPPFFQIPNTDDYKDEISFLNSYKVITNKEKNIVAKEIVGTSQISQCFFLKIKDWADEKTRFGFVSNSSNFDNDKSEKFQHYFYSNYGIEKIYELSRVKKILFEKANESVIALIFTNKFENNITNYYPVELGLFSEKPFELLTIQEDKVIPIMQEKLKNKELELRYFLVGNEYDFKIFNKLKNYLPLSNYILFTNGKHYLHEGLKIVGERSICKEYDISKDEWKNLNRNSRSELFKKFRKYNTSLKKNDEFNVGLLKPKNVKNFNYFDIELYLRENISNFERGRNPDIYKDGKIIFNRTGNVINSIYVKQKIYFDFDLHSIKLNRQDLYDFVNAVLNSRLTNYYINLFLRKRYNGSYPKIGNDDILNIPVPKLDEYLVSQISNLSQKLTEREYEYSDKENELNELIYELYELSYWEKQRIEDYFLADKEKRIGKKRTALDKYKSTLSDLLNFYFKNPIKIEETPTDIGLKVIKILLNQKSNTPTAQKTVKFLLNEIFEQNPNENFLASQEKIYGKDCVYIIKEDKYKNWTETKAFEDVQDLLKHLIPNENGERIY
ncbi:hypothetical protein JSO54_03720 [Riemerella anatipestifer]|uniref:DNA methyltransferase n=1 Tax=Riemerella anatipestifer TaxID=34085 RepID=UPI0030C0BAE9